MNFKVDQIGNGFVLTWSIGFMVERRRYFPTSGILADYIKAKILAQYEGGYEL